MLAGMDREPGSDLHAAAFEFEHVTVVHGDRRILDRLDARIPAAGITVITGPSGAGKTTLLRLCNRLDIPESGIIRYHGQRLDDLDPLVLRRQAGMVFQRPVPFPGSVAGNLAEARPGISTEAMARVLERVALDPALLDQQARTLSGGELQRMCLARTLVTGPETLLLDEPTSALDEQSKLVFEQTAKNLAAGGTTIIWVTHDDAQASRIADRVCQLRDGRLVAAHGDMEDPR